MRSRSGGAILKIFMAKGREPNMKRSSLIRSLCACLCAGLLAGSCTAYAAGMQEQARTRPRARPLCDGEAGRGTFLIPI